MYIDTHAHLNFKAFRKNLDNVLWEAEQKGVKQIVVPGADWDTSRRAVELARSYKSIFAAVGIHPHHAKEVLSKTNLVKLKADLLKLASSNKVVAIGECGLDYYQFQKTVYKNYRVDADFKKAQKELFKLQLQLANQLHLPVILHCREAGKDIQAVIDGFKGKFTGVFHHFEGDIKFLRWTLKKHFLVGFDGNITYDNSMDKIIKAAPLSKILVETDSPFLPPEPLRSQKIYVNRPENTPIIAGYIAKVKGETPGNIEKQTTENARQLFGL